MNRLQSELHRLYLPRSSAPGPSEAVRAMVMELTQPPGWEALSKVWHGVQTELDLPAPAIAVSGTDGLQLWFSLAEPIAPAQGHAFLDGLRSRFLPDIEPERLRLMPTREVPPRQQPSGNWSAFLAPDLAPVFADTPWLDVAPNEEGQSALLHGLRTMLPTELEAAMKRLAPAPQSVLATDAITSSATQDPRQFLLRVMNDDSVALALRIDAAKALLHAER